MHNELHTRKLLGKLLFCNPNKNIKGNSRTYVIQKSNGKILRAKGSSRN